ncbi:FAD-binding oxidoreductase [Nocardioides sp. ChNu-153]|uniref:FAD-dependent oxidoreductase n=1 Tax=Nocardioides sp. ChNu-153 TaxID=2779364 RepID=UPI0026555330|nr:FAD-dependent oxidoreductase [Nocardioides sp. ChNu-153]MDN7120650.1 FAD-binding oxidoreductase [Nocardioides sp. ChNu-153]
MSRVIVVGAGVVGLSAAVRLLEDGHRVDVVARDLPLETTSAVAGAIWYPYLAFPRTRVGDWGRTTYAVLDAIADTDPDAGVVLREGTEVFRTPTPDPWWADGGPALARETALPDGYVDGWTFRTPLVEMPVYLRWLAGRVEALGGTLTRMNLSALPSSADVVVNCTGIGSRLLASDRTVVPNRGQVVVVEQFGLERWWLDSSGDDPTYVLPRTHDVVVGGTDLEGEWSRTPSPEVAASILARAARLVPGLRDARVLRHKVGLRPLRPAVRVERVGDVVHCYGHGGAGVTLSWGCAEEVARLVGATGALTPPVEARRA